MIDVEGLLTVAQRLAAIPSPSGAEEEIAKWLAGHLSGLGFDVELQEVQPGRPNVLARWRADEPGPRLLLNGHLDTLPVDANLPDPFSGKVADGYLYGAGVNNMKGAVAAMVAALQAIAARRPPRGEVILSAVVGECDALGLGTVEALRAGLTADACINGEPTELNILTDHAGVTQLVLRVWGKEVHVFEKSNGINAIEKMAPLLPQIKADLLTGWGPDGLDRLPTVNIGTISGGQWPSLTAGVCEVGIDVRSTGKMTPQSILADMQKFVTAAMEADPQLQAEVELLQAPGFYQQRPYHVEPDTPIVRLVAEAHARLFNKPPQIGPRWPESFYGTDASHILHHGIPTVIYGPGSHSQISKPNERISVDELVQAATVYTDAALRFLQGELT